MRTLIERVRALSVEVGECWEWQGAVQSTSTTPMIRYGKSSISVARALAIEAGKPVKGLFATNTCRNPSCVNPDHVVVTTRRALNIKVAREQQYQRRPSYRATLSRNSGRRKISDEQVDEIRASSEGSDVLAKRYNITRSHVNSILSGWRRMATSANIFAGLLK